MSVQTLSILLVALALAGASDARDLADLPEDAVRVDARALDLARRSVGVHSLFARLQTSTDKADLAATVGALCHAPDALAAETALSRWLDGLQDLPSLDAELVAGLNAASRCPARVFMPHPESAGQWWVPAFPLGARAQSLLALESVRDQAATLARAWTEKHIEPLPADPGPRVSFLAVAGLDADTAAWLCRRPASLPGSALIHLARREYTATLFSELAVRASSEDLAADLPALLRQMPASARLPWLRQLAQRPELGSLAIASASQIDDRATADAWLLSLLGDTALGASAAQALAPRVSVGRWLEIAANAQASQTERVHATLALRLRGDAEPQLRVLAASGALPAELAAELLR